MLRERREPHEYREARWCTRNELFLDYSYEGWSLRPISHNKWV
jgi:hypothetical protein